MAEDTITCAPNRPARYTSLDDGTGILISWANSGSAERTVDREFPGYGTVVHYLGFGSILYSATIRLTAASFDLCVAEVQKWLNLKGCICDVTIDGNNRADETHANMKLDSVSQGRYYTSTGECSNTISVVFKKITQLGGSPV